MNTSSFDSRRIRKGPDLTCACVTPGDPTIQPRRARTSPAERAQSGNITRVHENNGGVTLPTSNFRSSSSWRSGANADGKLPNRASVHAEAVTNALLGYSRRVLRVMDRAGRCCAGRRRLFPYAVAWLGSYTGPSPTVRLRYPRHGPSRQPCAAPSRALFGDLGLGTQR